MQIHKIFTFDAENINRCSHIKYNETVWTESKKSKKEMIKETKKHKWTNGQSEL